MQFTSQVVFSMTTICLFFCLLVDTLFLLSNPKLKNAPLLPLYGEPWIDGAVKLMRAPPLRSVFHVDPGPRMPTRERSAQLGSSSEWREEGRRVRARLRLR